MSFAGSMIIGYDTILDEILIHHSVPVAGLKSNALKTTLSITTKKETGYGDGEYGRDYIFRRVVEDAYKQIYKTMKPQLQYMMDIGQLRGLIYNGDVDLSCNFLGDAWFTDDLDLEVTNELTPWKFNDKVLGFAKEYEFGDLIFTTIKGSGHMVPQDKPEAAFIMIEKFLNKKPFR
ncbi:lysosomal protective protein [Trichonephila clavipes]|nr:lysosomal protective protein [Trichonephila clavipes]